MTRTLPAPGPPAVRAAEPGRRRRRRLLGWSAPVVLVALLAAALLLGVTFGNAVARRDVESGAPTAAAERFDRHKRWTPVVVEPWKAWYNAGTATLLAGEAFRASADLRGALERVPSAPAQDSGALDPASAECTVRTNLSLAFEALGDDARGQGDPAMARSYYEEGLAVVAPCTSDGQPPPEEQPQEDPPPPRSGQDETEQRQQEKSREAQEEVDEQEQGGSPDGQEPPRGDAGEQDQEEQRGADGQDQDSAPPEPGDGQGAPEGGGGAAEQPDGTGGDPRLEELLERNREAEQDRQEELQRRDGGSRGAQNW